MFPSALENVLRIGEIGAHRHRAGSLIDHSAHRSHLAVVLIYGAVGKLQLHCRILAYGGMHASLGLRHVEHVLLCH